MSGGRVRPVGTRALRIEREGPVERLPQELRALRALPTVLAARGTERYLLLEHPLGAAPTEEELLSTLAFATVGSSEELPAVVVPVRYDGEDLEPAAEALGLTPKQLVERHAEREYLVLMLGFLPGFAYLGPVPEGLRLPRRSAPRARVPALSVGLAEGYTGIYPATSPGGWHLLGTALGIEPFHPERGALFAVGRRVRFEPSR